MNTVVKQSFAKTDFCLKKNRVNRLKKLISKAQKQGLLSDHVQVNTWEESALDVKSNKLYFMENDIATYVTSAYLVEDC